MLGTMLSLLYFDFFIILKYLKHICTLHFIYYFLKTGYKLGITFLTF